MMLGELGAEVIKIEKPGGDPARDIGPFYHDEVDPEKSLFFTYHNTGKKSITLDLESKDGQEIFKKLAKTADVVIETSPVGYMQSLGLGYDALKEVNPNLVMTSITPFGQSGPYKDYKASSDIIPLALGGLMFLIGDPSTPPVQIGHFWVGHAVSIYAAVGTMSAIHNRHLTGEGEHIDISTQECVVSWLESALPRYQTDGLITVRNGTEHPRITPGKNFPCKDGYVNIGAVIWNLLVVWLINEGVDVGDLADPKYAGPEGGDHLFNARPRVNKAVTEMTMKHNKVELMLEGQKRGIPVGALQDAKTIYEDEHLEARGYFAEVDHPVIGKLKYPGPPFRMTESPWQMGGPAPLVGQHNEEIYHELGISDSEVTRLKAAGVI